MEKIGVAVDIVLFFKDEVLLVKRVYEPFKNKWVFPGGFVEPKETLLKAAKRELKEETGVSNVKLKRFDVVDTVGRDPRGRVITFVHYGYCNKNVKLKTSAETKDVKWFKIKKLPKLGADHGKILKDLLKRLKK